MPRQYPRFLYSDPTNTKSKGPFVVHLLFPRFICRVCNVEEVQGKDCYYVNYSGWTVELLDVFETNVNDPVRRKVSDAMYDMIAWLASREK